MEDLLLLVILEKEIWFCISQKIKRLLVIALALREKASQSVILIGLGWVGLQ
jgi:hypothetical protein